MVGPILLEEAKPLPADLNIFLDKAMSTGRGAVYVSMGTLVVLSADEARSMAAALSALDSFVLWKLDSAHLPGLLFCFCNVPLTNLILFIPLCISECLVDTTGVLMHATVFT